MNSEEIKGIPLIYVFKVFNLVIELISSGECFYKENQL